MKERNEEVRLVENTHRIYYRTSTVLVENTPCMKKMKKNRITRIRCVNKHATDHDSIPNMVQEEFLKITLFSGV